LFTRYRIMKTLDTLKGECHVRCVSCGKLMTPKEVYYFGTTCEKCEQKQLKRLENERVIDERTS
jgi:hypothetical protein